MIQAVDHCITHKGEYQSSRRLGKDKENLRCLQMPELSSDEQIIIMEIIESIQKETQS